MVDQAVYELLKPMPPFMPEMRAANRSGRKTQTRRVMNPQPSKGWMVDTLGNGWSFYHRRGDGAWEDIGKFMCPYGQAGDIRYMREPLVRDGGYARYKDDGAKVKSLVTGEVIEWRWKRDVLSGMFMPKEAARTFRKYEFIRVERVQAINNLDALAEGVDDCRTIENNFYLVNCYHNLWDKINSARGYPWSSNPWVWVIGYEQWQAGQGHSPALTEEVRDAS